MVASPVWLTHPAAAPGYLMKQLLIHLQCLGCGVRIVPLRRILRAGQGINGVMVKRHAVGKADAVYLPARLEMVSNGDLVVSILATQDEIVAFATDVKIAAVHVAEINTVMPSRSGIVVVDDVITVSACEMVDVITAPTIQNIIPLSPYKSS